MIDFAKAGFDSGTYVKFSTSCMKADKVDIISITYGNKAVVTFAITTVYVFGDEGPTCYGPLCFGNPIEKHCFHFAINGSFYSNSF
ncbi:hypothetical protein C9374_013121 [Naegleria lovaniensis]|uniref:Uncharacterized protein n=1 Tax=Naegleria lovaniensis TaxID=51637 RepID=A0AA88GF08_NAELO|nr:uncharacterized protein C9374_013121 [Naegleria lovaniensis]KAG2372841.1 hypothetical protein C9374_013121 [Naegleria lovaniensis]